MNLHTCRWKILVFPAEFCTITHCHPLKSKPDSLLLILRYRLQRKACIAKGLKLLLSAIHVCVTSFPFNFRLFCSQRRSSCISLLRTACFVPNDFITKLKLHDLCSPIRITRCTQILQNKHRKYVIVLFWLCSTLLPINWGKILLTLNRKWKHR